MACAPGECAGSLPSLDPNRVLTSLSTAERVSLTPIGVLVDSSLMHCEPVNLGPLV